MHPPVALQSLARLVAGLLIAALLAGCGGGGSSGDSGSPPAPTRSWRMGFSAFPPKQDAAKVVLAGTHVTTANAKKSAAVVAKTIAAGKLDALDGHALSEIQNWKDKDETLVGKLIEPLTMAVDLPERYAGGNYAAHVVSAAVMAALQSPGAIPVIFDRMLGALKVMHDANPSWGPLYVVHPGDVARDFVVGKRKPKVA